MPSIAFGITIKLDNDLRFEEWEEEINKVINENEDEIINKGKEYLKSKNISVE